MANARPGPPALMMCRPCLEFRLYVRRIEGNGVYASDLPPASEDEVYDFFNQFGNIADFYLAEDHKYCLVNYTDSEALEVLLHYPVSMFGCGLRIRRRHANNQDQQGELPLYHEQLLNQLLKKESFKEQMEEFMTLMAADESNLTSRREVCRHMEDALKKLSSTYKIQPFGSSVNGLAFKDSDLDIFFGKEPSTRGPEVFNVLNKVSIVLRKHPHFTSMRPIPNARVPIIKVVHKGTGCNCDLSFKNGMGVQNSRLIKFITTIDERIKPLLMIVKFWARLHHLTGKRMSNYALIMLLINFLQSLNEPLLPPLNMLKHANGPNIKIADWPITFDYDATRLPPITNPQSVEELLLRFFESMGVTDFGNYVISPLSGMLIHKRYFADMDLSADMKDYVSHVQNGNPRIKVDSVLCIQDPIELNLNLTKNVSKHDLQCFRDHCNVAVDLSQQPGSFLPKLLADVYPQLPNHDRKSWHRNPMHVPPKPLRPFMTISVPIPENVDNRILWRDELVHKLKLILKKVLKIDVDHETPDKESKPGADQNLVCIGSQVLWQERDELWRRWCHKETDILMCDNEEEVQVVYMKDESDQSAQGSSSMKRKSNGESSSSSSAKRRKLDEPKERTVEGDIIIIESAETDRLTSNNSFQVKTNKNASSKRSLQDEINLTNEMVRRKHALPASKPILHFTCSICLDVNSARIEMADRKSVNNYFNSLSSFLQNCIVQHIIDLERD